MSSPSPARLSILQQLEAETIHIFREVVAEFERPVMLYSVGKDSAVMVHLARKAFHPAPLPFPLLHVDTGFKFPEMYAFRDQFAKDIGAELIVHRNEKAIGDGANPWDLGTQRCCGFLKTQALLDGLRAGNFDAAFGGARRDEERSRAKERIYSFRDERGQWDPRNQRPELWNLYNGRIHKGEGVRVFPISNWTELDVWYYIHLEDIPVVPMYFAREQDMVVRDDQVIPITEKFPPRDGDVVEKVMCRFRTLGCSPCTGAVRSEATTIPEIIEELLDAKYSERIGRVIDHDSDGSMEQKKREGYF